MSDAKAWLLLENGRAHALSATLLFNASRSYGEEIGVAPEEIDKFAFNGTCSLSVFFLIGLGVELMLKAAYVAYGGDQSDEHLRTEIGHDLKVAMKKAEALGFSTEATSLSDLISYLNRAYKQNYLRYGRPDKMNLPDNMEQVATIFEVLDAEISHAIENLSKVTE